MLSPTDPFVAVGLGLPVQNLAHQYDVCNGNSRTTGFSPANWTIDTAGYFTLASANPGTMTGVSPGSSGFATHATGIVYHFNGNTCSVQSRPPLQSNGTGCVGNLAFGATAENFIFVGTDSALANANSYFLRGTPSGGAYTGSSSNSPDAVTLTFVSSLGLEKVSVQTTTQSTTSGDRKLTFTYAPLSCQAAALTQQVTARQFAYATNGALSNTCSLGHGYHYDILYTPYTHPDKAAAPPNINLDGTGVTETFSPTTIACGGITGDGALDANSQFSDHIAVCSTQPIPACSSTNSQVLKVAGYTVRTNSLTITNTGLTYTSQGPTQ